MIKKFVRAYKVVRSYLFWKWRLGNMGRRVVLDKPLNINNPGVVSIGDFTNITSGSVLADLNPGGGQYPKIKIGCYCTILYRFQCNTAESVVVGDYVLMASNVLITDSDHVVEPGGTPVTINKKLNSSPVVIEENCWIGQNSVILKGVTIGRDSIVGANSVVTHDVPSRSVVAGNPARVIKKLEGQA